MAIITLDGFCDSPLWNSSLSWGTTNDSWPEFTQCFQLAVLVWIPCGWLWLTLPFYVYYLINNVDKWRPLTVFSITKTVVSVMLTGLVLGDLATDTYRSSHLTVVYEAVILQAITYILSALLMQTERLRGIVTSGVLFIFWLLCTITGIIPFYSKIILKEYEKDAIHFGLFYAFYALILLQLVFHCIAEPLPKEESPSGKRPSPELDASFPSRLWYFWVDRIVIKAFRKNISEGDLWMLHPRDQSISVVPDFQRTWDGEVNKYLGINTEDKLPSDTLKSIYKVSSKSKKKPSLTWVLLKVYFLELWKSWMCKFTHDLLMFVSPMILKLLIDFTASNELVWKGYVLAFFMLIIPILQSTAFQYSFHISMTLGMRVRSALTSSVFRKSLSIRNSERKTTTIGEIVNIMSVDCQRVQDVIPYLYILVSAPLQISLALYFLYQQLGPSIFSGVAILILLIPFNAVIMSYIQKWKAQQMKVKDIRIKMMNEVLNGMKVIKLYAWEPAFEKKVNLVRSKEINLLRKVAYMNALSTFSWTVAPFLVTLASFGTYVLSSHENKLDAEKAFVSLSLFNILRAPINMLPMMVSFLAQLKISLNRTEKFLNSSDIPKDIVIHTHTGENAVQVIKGRFTWDREDSSCFTLKDINIKIPTGKLVAIVGSVGTGKSSLISAILGEMEKIQGEVEIQGKVAYVPQEAWIQNETLMNNILFGKKLKQDMYDRIVYACAMQPDIDILPGGSQAEIGEKGINLSGGQRQRVSLARAVYQNADIYLFDDPLSAVDSHVGKHIFNQVIGNDGLLQNKTRILVTHGIQWLPKVDYILVLNNGVITENGTYEDLLEHDGPFAQFLQTYLTQEDEENEDDDEIIELKNRILQRVNSVCSDKDEKNQSINGKELMRKNSTIENMTTKEEQVNGHIGKSRKSHNSIFNKKSKSGVFEMKDLKESDIKGKNLIEAEKSEIGKVKLNVYITYAKSIGLMSSLLVLALYFLFQVFAVFGNIWLSWWSEDRLADKSPKANGTEPESKLDIYLGVYGSIGIAQALFVLGYSIVASFSLLKGAKCLQEDMLGNVLHCPMNFFDTTPLGRILNRFSKDVDTIDNTLPLAIRQIIATLFLVMSTLFTISYTTPIFMSIIVPIAVLYYVIQNYYLPTSRQLKRMESVTRSPIYSMFSETLAGAASIRAYGVQKEFQQRLENMVDNNLTSFSMSLAANRWLGVRLETLGNLIVFAAALFAVSNRDTMTPGSVGLSLSYALNVTFFLSWFVRNRSEVETNIVGVERISEYCKLENEADWYKENHPDNSWPSKGNITFDNYQLRYRPELDLVLKGISCSINGGEKIGIVGRTGAGKSSLTVSLFRLIESAGGNIIIDGQNISELGLHDLRSKLTILPQEPIIFSGALRNNLDPLEQFADENLWSALELSHLKTFVKDLNKQLDYECGENGGNLSVGQRQLICLARSILHKTKILILDEATAAVDMETDQLIQHTIRTQFKDTTILTIAHRLNTIMDYDRILVLDKGLLKEFDSPEALLKNKESLFYGMAKNAGLV